MLQAVAQSVVNQEALRQDNMVQDRLQNLQHFIDTRDQVWLVLNVSQHSLQIKTCNKHMRLKLLW